MTGSRIIGFAGLSHLGLCSAVAAAERLGARGRVVGFDPDAALVARIGCGDLPVVEPDLDDLMARNRHRIDVAADPAALAACDLVYVARDVPTDDAGQSDLAPVQDLIALIQPHLRADACLVMLCQVPPGFTRRLSVPPDRLFYQVETLIFGRAMERALSPERIILGQARAAAPLPSVLAGFLDLFQAPILPMAYESAELAKLSINLCLVASVSVANVLADLSARVGADWGEIVPALKLDRRIGPSAYLQPGLGIAGGNLERDLVNVCRMAEEAGAEAGVIAGFLADSRYRKDWLLRTVQAHLGDGGRIGLLGLAYKEDTASLKNAPSLALLDGLGPATPVAAYDPAVPSDGVVRAGLVRVDGVAGAVAGADLVVIATPWREFRTIDPVDLAARMRGRVVIDPYRLLDEAAAVAAGLQYFCLGKGPVRV